MPLGAVHPNITTFVRCEWHCSPSFAPRRQWGLWIPGPRYARPGMTVVGNSFQQTLPLTPTLSPQAGRGRRGSSHRCAIQRHIATDNRWHLSPRRGERSDCEAIRVRGKAHRGIHNHGIAFGARWGCRSCSKAAVGVMDSGLALRAPRNDDGGCCSRRPGMTKRRRPGMATEVVVRITRSDGVAPPRGVARAEMMDACAYDAAIFRGGAALLIAKPSYAFATTSLQIWR
jgi:hypothetical protein